MTHFGFILASYLAAIAVLAIVAFWLYWDYRTQKKALAELEARGVTRRGKNLQGQTAARVKKDAV